MATTKKATTVVKDDAKKVTVKEEPVKETAKPAEKADAKTAVKGEEKAVAEVKTVKKAAKTPEKGTKAPAKKAEKAPAKKAEIKESVSVQFDGKSYTTEELVKIAKDVWKYDHKKKVSDFQSVELYVKTEESIVYYVINGEVSGSFAI